MDNKPENHSEKLAEYLKKIPHGPGVYLYSDNSRKVIYVGKAVDLYRRVHQYFQKLDRTDEKTKFLVRNVNSIKTIRTVSEFDALLLEARLINQYKPKYNIIAKDDKSPLYVQITFSEPLPRIKFVRKREFSRVKPNTKDSLFGPFQSAKVARNIFRRLRHITPYCTESRRDGKPCFYTHIGLCNPCPSEISVLKDSRKKIILTGLYRHNLLRLKNILTGKTKTVIRDLNRDMDKFARQRDFESAARVRDEISELNSLISIRFDPMLYTTGYGIIEKELFRESEVLNGLLQRYFPQMKGISRIECIDISNLMGSSATGSLVAMTDGLFDTALYRKFKIHFPKANDFAMIGEVISRRFRHTEWKYPDLVVIDGGKGQLTAARSAMDNMGLNIPVIGLAKRMEDIIVPDGQNYLTLRIPLDNPALQILQRIRDEAHRFAVSYHRHLRQKSFLVG